MKIRKPESKLASSLKSAINQDFLDKLAEGASAIDSDNDGLKDWEEALWGTNINNSDSDGDGYDDAAEIKSSFDPLDKLSSEKTGKKKEISGQIGQGDYFDYGEQPNLTQMMARNISAKMVGNEDGNLPDLSNPLSLVDESNNTELARFIASLNVKIPEKEFIVSPDNGAEAIKKYLEEIKTLFSKNISFGKSGEDLFITAAMTNDFSEIDNNIAYFDRIVYKMKTISVPSVFLQFHKKQAELWLATRNVFEGIKATNKDPLRAILAAKEYERISREMKDLWVGLTDNLK